MQKIHALPPPTALPSRHPESGNHLAVIETPRGCRVKMKFDEDLQAFSLSKILPAGAVFPFDFGFIPQTLAEDGDPLDVLVLMDEPVPMGCAVEVRLVGVIEAKQKEQGADWERNDRIIAVAVASVEYAEVESMGDLPPALLREIEHFFISYHEMGGGEFKPIGRHNGKHAAALLRKALKRAERRSDD